MMEVSNNPMQASRGGGVDDGNRSQDTTASATEEAVLSRAFSWKDTSSPTELVQAACDIPQNKPQAIWFLLINTMIGSGVLNQAEVFSKAGMIGGLIMLIFVGEIGVRGEERRERQPPRTNTIIITITITIITIITI